MTLREPPAGASLARLAVLTYTAEPGSKSAEALDLLGSWTATIDAADAAKASEAAS